MVVCLIGGSSSAGRLRTPPADWGHHRHSARKRCPGFPFAEADLASSPTRGASPHQTDRASLVRNSTDRRDARAERSACSRASAYCVDGASNTNLAPREAPHNKRSLYCRRSSSFSDRRRGKPRSGLTTDHALLVEGVGKPFKIIRDDRSRQLCDGRNHCKARNSVTSALGLKVFVGLRAKRPAEVVVTPAGSNSR